MIPYLSKLLLKDWYSENCLNESPTDRSKLIIAKKAGISVKELNRWLRNKKRRTLCNVKDKNRYEYTIVLEKYFLHKARYLDTKGVEMQELMNETMLSSVQIQKWFANKRRAENISAKRYRKGKKNGKNKK